MESPECELCAADRLTTWWFENEVCWVADCDACGVPMVVWKRHGPEPPPEEREEMLQRLRDVAERVGPPNYWIDDRLRTIPDHFHAHARRRPFV